MEADSPENIDENVSNFVNLMENVCYPLFVKMFKSPENGFSHQNSTKSPNNPWFDEECQILRDRFYTKLNIYRENKSDVNAKKMINAQSNFKNLMRKKRYIYDKAKTDKLISTKYQNAKAYWRLLKQTANKNTKNSISLKQFADYFKALNDPSDRVYQVDEDIMFFNERYVRGEIQIMFDELNREILKTELITAIKQLRNGASSGPDLLLNEFFKNGSETLIHYLHALFNKLFQIGYFPEKWSEG